MFKRFCFAIFLFETLLGLAHLLWPEFHWGQGRKSYFNFNNSLTLASWFASMQLAGVAVLALVAFHREQRFPAQRENSPTTWIWVAGGLLALTLSLAEITRFVTRLRLLGYPHPDAYQSMVLFALWAGLLALFGWFLLVKFRHTPLALKGAFGWLVMWGLALLLQILSNSTTFMPADGSPGFTLVRGLAYLFGCTSLLMALGAYVLHPTFEKSAPAAFPLPSSERTLFLEGNRRIWILSGVGGITFTIIFLQILLFRLLTIFGDYLTANSVISIALLGISIGGLLGFFSASRAPLSTMTGASLLLPLSILVAFGTSVSLMETSLLASLLLTLPFICGSTVITVVLARSQSHLVYFIDLVGAALGALFVSAALTHFREESSLLFLCGLTCIIAIFFIIFQPRRLTRYGLISLSMVGALGFGLAGSLNMKNDGLNIVQTKVEKRYPRAKVLFSRSSLVGRYDIIRRKPNHKSIAAYENGRITDNIRKRPTEDYRIDPRLPHTLMQQPTILILGVSGDAITKTAKFMSNKVYGAEINPAVVDLQTNELVKFNANSYENIEVAVMDGRSYVEQSDRRYDMITLMNAHGAQGRTEGRSPSPEYLHTREAISAYLTRLTERGLVIVEEPVSRPRREPPVWKLLVTMVRALREHGATHPERHFFIFQWRTKRNNYIQILMKKNPLSAPEISNLKQWLQDVDNIREIEKQRGRRMGPIRCKTTLLYSPDTPLYTNYARIVKGEAPEAFLLARNLTPTTDDRPFHFDVDPNHPGIKASYQRTLLMMLLLFPFFAYFLARHRSGFRYTLPYVMVVGLTGMGYFLVEMVLIQRFAIFLGSPVVTFSTILGALLIFSGLGSLWSGGLDRPSLYAALGGILLFLILHQWWVPSLFSLAAALPLAVKIVLTVTMVAPLAFFMGVPFPYVMRMGNTLITDSAAAMLFAVNAATSALAVPLAMNLSMAFGMRATFQTGLIIYLVVGFLLISLNHQRLRTIANGMGVAVLCLLAIGPWSMGRSQLGFTEGLHQYRVYGLSYGHSSFRESKIFAGGAKAKFRSFEWLFWVVQGNGRTILVDTGTTNGTLARKRKISNYTSPVKRLQQMGITPAEVTDVILTHAQWDHMGGLVPYKNARIWIQQKEYAYARARLSPQKPKSKSMRWEDLSHLAAAEKEGRLNLVDGQATLAPGITMTLDGGHTPGHQYVTVETLDGPVIISGDATYLYENNQWHKPIGSAFDTWANLQTIRSMHTQAASPLLILPGHDPLVMKRFPQVSEGIVQITTIAE